MNVCSHVLMTHSIPHLWYTFNFQHIPNQNSCFAEKTSYWHDVAALTELTWDIDVIDSFQYLFCFCFDKCCSNKMVGEMPKLPEIISMCDKTNQSVSLYTMFVALVTLVHHLTQPSETKVRFMILSWLCHLIKLSWYLFYLAHLPSSLPVVTKVSPWMSHFSNHFGLFIWFGKMMNALRS